MARNRPDDDDRPRRKATPNGMPVWGWMIIGGSVLVFGGTIAAGVAFVWLSKKADQIQANKTPDVIVMADELNNEVANNTAAAAKYEGKLIRISGIMEEVTGNIEGKTFLRFKHTKYSPVRCFFDNPSVLSHLKKGDSVTLQGYVSRPGMTVDVSPCVLVNR